MFRLIHLALQLDKYYGVNEDFDFLKGGSRYPDTIKDAISIAWRKIKSNNDKEKC